MKKFLFVFLLFAAACIPDAHAKKITIHVVPETATIYRDGMDVGTGTYTVDFKSSMEFVVLKLVADGYIERRITVRKDTPKKEIMFTLQEDEAMKESIGSGEGQELANKWFDVTCKQGISEETIWKRLMNICVTNFENIEVRDKSAGWIRSAWVVTHFKNQDVRTRLEVRISFTDDETLTYRVRLTSEIKESRQGANAYHKYDRLLRKYESVVTELQTTVGSNL